jgi:hypothetical protein
MKKGFVFVFLMAAGLSAACTPRSFSDPSAVKEADTNVDQVNAKAFNAFLVWHEGQKKDILSYPQSWSVSNISHQIHDGVFYVEHASYWQNHKFVGVPTQDSKVANDVLVYSVKNGKQLKLKFLAQTEKKMTQFEAAEHCQNRDLRLPTVREILDYCTTGAVDFEPNNEPHGLVSTARCGSDQFWSASVNAANRSLGWLFDGSKGTVIGNNDYRHKHFSFFCVGPE